MQHHLIDAYHKQLFHVFQSGLLGEGIAVQQMAGVKPTVEHPVDGLSSVFRMVVCCA